MIRIIIYFLYICIPLKTEKIMFLKIIPILFTLHVKDSNKEANAIIVIIIIIIIIIIINVLKESSWHRAWNIFTLSLHHNWCNGKGVLDVS